MAKDSSFDVVSEVDRQEVDNALNQTSKELVQRFDFKGTGAKVEWTGDLAIRISAGTEDRALAALEVLKEKAVKRKISLKALDAGPPTPTGGGGTKVDVTIVQGINQDKARAIVKAIKDAKLKSVQSAVQGEQVRVSAKSKDALQETIALLKETDFGIPLQFVNYR
jgi:hypothetical protein